MKASYGFSFKYGDKKFDQNDLKAKGTANGDALVQTGVLEADSSLEVIGALTEYPEYATKYWVTEYANVGTEDTKNLSELNDADVLISFDEPYKPAKRGYYNDKYVTVTAFHGSQYGIYEYGGMEKEIRLGNKVSFATNGGRSCNVRAPYFVVNCGDSGVVIGLGWTGQWNATFEYTEEGIKFTYGVEGADFYLKPGEKVRTGSLLITEYDNGRINGHNAFRRVLKERCVLGKGQRPAYGRVSAMTWGAMKSQIMIEHIEMLKKLDCGVECFFIDAGWYGHSTDECKNEHEGDWSVHTGSWNVNPTYHPDGFMEVSESIEKADMEMLLWIEPERARRGTDWVKAHPEYMIGVENSDNFLVNIGIDGAWQMMFDMLSGLIEKLNIRCYRQDFNFDPLVYWRKADEEGRAGLTEIKYINALYRLWDALLDRFPKLYIDNCASGGRRNDIEMLARSIPLWRSDYQCNFNADPEVTQAHGTGISTLVPYSGTGVNCPMEDTYGIRSSYAAALSIHTWWWTQAELVEDVPELANAKRVIREYKEIRPYFSCDFYPLTEYSLSKRVWCVWQYNDPERAAGTVIAFRRSESNISKMTLQMYGLEDADYVFTNMDTGEEIIFSGKKLMESGLEITLPMKRSSVVFKYQKK